LFLIEAGFRRLPVSEFWHPLIGAVGFATVGQFVPGALGVGYDEIADALAGRLIATTVAGLLVAKLLAWWVALGSGTSGGTLAPLLLISGCVGTLYGDLVAHVLPGFGLPPAAFALAAMAATFGAATRTPLASVIFLLELTHDLDAAAGLIGATAVATLASRRLLPDSLMTEKLTRRGHRVRHDYHADPGHTLRLDDVMTTDVAVIEYSKRSAA
jgi:CIC family chloride channel protein